MSMTTKRFHIEVDKGREGKGRAKEKRRGVCPEREGVVRIIRYVVEMMYWDSLSGLFVCLFVWGMGITSYIETVMYHITSFHIVCSI